MNRVNNLSPTEMWFPGAYTACYPGRVLPRESYSRWHSDGEYTLNMRNADFLSYIFRGHAEKIGSLTIAGTQEMFDELDKVFSEEYNKKLK